MTSIGCSFDKLPTITQPQAFSSGRTHMEALSSFPIHPSDPNIQVLVFRWTRSTAVTVSAWPFASRKKLRLWRYHASQSACFNAEHRWPNIVCLSLSDRVLASSANRPWPRTLTDGYHCWVVGPILDPTLARQPCYVHLSNLRGFDIGHSLGPSPGGFQ